MPSKLKAPPPLVKGGLANKPVIERNMPDVLTIRLDGVRAGWEQWFMLSSDHHWDNPHCDRELLTEHLEKAKARDALVLIFGDLFCAMQGKYDPRKALGDIRPEHDGPDYLDRLVRTAAEFYGPYAENIALISKGNHETSVLDRCGVSLTGNLVSRLNDIAGGTVTDGPYTGWVRLMAEINKTGRQQVRLNYHHGSGGGGPVTRGVIQSNRQAVYMPDADIVVNGHTHDAWTLPIARERISDKGLPFRDLCWFVRTPAYKSEYGTDGWADTRWQPPKPAGCVWLKLTYAPRPSAERITKQGHRRAERSLLMELTPDIS